MDSLTPRELDVARLIARGLSNKQIARELGLSPHTVKRHVALLLDRIDVASRTEAALWYASQPMALEEAPRRSSLGARGSEAVRAAIAILDRFAAALAA